MATTTEKETIAPSRPHPGDPQRVAAIRADLLPGEIIQSRATDSTRKRVLVGLVGVLALLVGLYAFSTWQTGKAQDDLAAAQGRAQALQAKQNSYRPLVAAIADTAAIQSQLRTLMHDDLSWRTLIASVGAAAPAGVRLSSFSATVDAPGAATTTTGVATNGVSIVGTLTVQGVAPAKTTVAAFLDRLGTTKGLVNPLLGSAATAPQGVSFTVTVSVTSDALGGRFANGGK